LDQGGVPLGAVLRELIASYEQDERR
jgi:hypothetical protein